jgi:hypothetical protein
MNAIFENMQKNEEQFAPESGMDMWKQDKDAIAEKAPYQTQNIND